MFLRAKIDKALNIIPEPSSRVKTLLVLKDEKIISKYQFFPQSAI